MRFFSTILAASLVVATAAPAFAHTGAGGTSGFMHGFMHPIGGLDHVLAMVAVGLFAFLLGGGAKWRVPAAFVAMMAVGGLLAVNAVAVPFVEVGIALSVVVIGALVAAGRGMPVAVAMAVVGLFAVFHGHAHGLEMPVTSSGIGYGLGFMLATALLHGAGLGVGYLAALSSARHGNRMVRVGGAATCALGVAILVGVL